MKQFLFIIVAGMLLSALLVGCGGGDAKSLGMLPGSAIRIGVSTDITGQSALNSGATIEFFDFQTGQKLADTTTGVDGYGMARLTPGLTVLVLVNGERDGKTYRLSTIIPYVPTADAEYLIDPQTTLAAELLGEKFFKKSLIDQDTFEAVCQVATEWLNSHPNADIALGGGILNSGFSFGSEGALNQAEVTAIANAIPNTIDDNLVRAKNGLQQIKEAGTPINSIMSQEIPSLGNIGMSVIQTLGTIDLHEVGEKYTDLGDRLNLLILPAIQGNWDITGDDVDDKTLFDLTMGQGYRAELHTETELGYTYTWLSLTPNDSLNVANQITIKLTTADDTYRLVAVKNGTSGWTITQTAQGDASLKYTATLPINVAFDANPSFTGTISLKDQFLPVAVTYNGSAKAVGPDHDHYSYIEYSGTLKGEELIATGSFTARFEPTVPAGAAAGRSIYDFPTSFTMRNAGIAFNADGVAAEIKGEITATAKTMTVEGTPRTCLTNFQLTGSKISVSANAHSATLTGNITVKLSYLPDGDRIVTIPNELSITNAGIELQAEEKIVRLGGSFSVKGLAVMHDGHPVPALTWAKLTGSYSNNDSKQSFDGTIEAKWDNPVSDVDFTTAKGSVSMKGELVRENYKAYALDLLFNINGAGTVNCTLNRLAVGAFSLTGSAHSTLVNTVNGMRTTDSALTLLNQDNVKLTLTQNGDEITGTMVSGNVKVADIARDDTFGKLAIHFTDGTVKLLPF